MTLVRQLLLVLATLTWMSLAAQAGVGWAVFAFAFIGGDALSQHDPGMRRG